jgi:hypothetical protein
VRAWNLPDGRKVNQPYYGSGHLHQLNLDGQVTSDMERDDLHREVYLSEPGSYAPLARVDQVEGGRAEGLLLPYGPGWYAAGTDGQRRHNR